MSNELGTLVVVVLKARNLLDKHSFYKQDVYAQVKINGVTKKTGVDVKGGQHPEWDEELRFPISQKVSEATRTLEVSCWSKEPRTDDNVGTGKLDLKETIQTGEFDDWIPLSIDDKVRGDIYLEMTFYAAGPPPSLSRRASKLPPKERLTHIAAKHQNSFLQASPPRSPPRSPNPAYGQGSTFPPQRPPSSSGSYLAPSGHSRHTSPHQQHSTLSNVSEEPSSGNVPSILKPGRPGGNRSPSPSSTPGPQGLPPSLAPHRPQSTYFPPKPSHQNSLPAPVSSPPLHPTPAPTLIRPASAEIQHQAQAPPAIPTYQSPPPSVPVTQEESFPSFSFPTPQASVDYTPPPQTSYPPAAQSSYNPLPQSSYNPHPIQHTPPTPIYQQPASFPFTPPPNSYPYGYSPTPRGAPEPNIGLQDPLGNAPSRYQTPAAPYQPPYNPSATRYDAHSPAPYTHGYGTPPNVGSPYSNGYRPPSAHPRPGSKGPPPPPKPQGPPRTNPSPPPPPSQTQPQVQPQPQPAPVVVSIPVAKPQQSQPRYDADADRNLALELERQEEEQRKRWIQEQEQRDLELARKLDLELNLDERGSSGARPSLDGVRMPGAW